MSQEQKTDGVVNNQGTEAAPTNQVTNPELWQFPMEYPIKLIGLATPELVQSVHDIILQHFPLYDITTTEVIPSSKGTYHSVRAVLPFENLDQVHKIYADFAQCPHIKTAV